MTLTHNWKHFTHALTGNVSAQAVSFLFYPILVRIYSPEAFGIFGTFTSLVVISSIFASGQFHTAFVKAHSPLELSQLRWFFRRFSLIGTFLVSGLVLVLNYYFSFFPNLPVFIMLFPLSVLSFLYFEEKKMLAISLQQFSQNSMWVTANRIFSNVLKITFGFFYPFPWVMLLSESSANILSGRPFGKKLSVEVIKPTKAKELLIEYKQFPIFGTFSNFFQLGLLELPVLLFALHYSKSNVGYYALAVRMFLQPFVIIGNSVGSVIAREFVQTSHDNRRSSFGLLAKLYCVVIIGGICCTISVLILPDWIYETILGEKWKNAGEIIRPISLLCSTKLCAGIHSYYFIATGRMKIKSLFRGLQLCSVVAVIVLNSGKPLYELLWLTSAIEISVDLFFMISSLYWARRRSSS